MKLFRTDSFAHKMTYVVLLASSMALITLSATLVAFDYVSSRSLSRHRLSTLATIVGQNSTAALDFDDRAAAAAILEALRAEPTVVTGCLYDLSGARFARFQRDLGNADCPAEPSTVELLNSDYSTVEEPVLRHGERIGTLFLKSDLQDFATRRSKMLQATGLLLIVALLVGGFSGSILQRRISKPIFDLAQAMREAASQNYEARVRVSGSDEIAQLGTGFNSMISELERRALEKKKAEQQLQNQALTDELTGLPNRRLFATASRMR